MRLSRGGDHRGESRANKKSDLLGQEKGRLKHAAAIEQINTSRWVGWGLVNILTGREEREGQDNEKNEE